MQTHLNQIRDRLTQKQIQQFEIYLSSSQGSLVQVKEGHKDVFEKDHLLGFGLRVKHQGCLGFSYSSDFSASAIDQTIAAACDAAVYSGVKTEMDFVGKPDSVPKLEQWDGSLSQRSFEDKLDLACQLEEMAKAYNSKVKRVNETTYRESFEEVYLVTSAGFNHHYAKTDVQLSLMVVAENKGESEAVYEHSFTNHFDQLGPQDLAHRAAEKAVSLLGGQRIPNYEGPIVITPSVGVEMLEILAPSALGDNIYKNNSFLIGKKGQKIYSDQVSIIDDGLYPGGYQTAPFDAEGVLSQQTPVIAAGVVQNFLYNRQYAELAGTTSTGNGFREEPKNPPRVAPRNFYVQPGTLSSDQLLATMAEGVMVSEVIGMHTANPISGDFSVGIQGFMVKGGQRDHPLRSVMLTGNLHDLWARITQVGSDLRFYGAMGCPSFLVERAAISGEREGA